MQILKKNMANLIKQEIQDAYSGKIEDDNNLKCGEIVFSNNIKFYFSCLFCQRVCDKIQEFFRHILYDHFNYLDEYQFSDDEEYSVPKILQQSKNCKRTQEFGPVALKEEPEKIQTIDFGNQFDNFVSDDTTNRLIKTEINEEEALDFDFPPDDDPPCSADTTQPSTSQCTPQDILHIEILEDPSESGDYVFENVTTLSNENSSDSQTLNTDEEDGDGSNYLDEHDETHLHSEDEENCANEEKTVKTKETIYKCSQCRKVFLTETGIKRHTVNFHSGRPKTDDEDDDGNNYLNEHDETYLHSEDEDNCANKEKTVKTKETIYKCSQCRKVFLTETGMKRHTVNVHSAKPDQLTCDQCPKMFKNENQLNLHMKRHMGVKPHSCDICGSCFSDKSNLNVHILRHKGIKPHKCTLCEKRFHSTTEQKLHMRSHTGERPFICEVCGRKFSNSGHLCSHRRRHFGEKRFQCDHCEKRFFDRKLLNDHKVMHTDERPFSCGLCGATFQRKKALLQHEKLHSDVKQYVCKICGKSFAQNAGLYSHMKYH